MKPLRPLQIPPGFKPVKFKSKTSAHICYIILCNGNGKQYVGSGQSGRVWKHFKEGEGNEKLYEDFREFGKEAFEILVKDCRSEEEYKRIEQILLDSLIKTRDGMVCHPDYYYNVMIKVGGGNTHDPENPKDKRNDRKAWAKASEAGGGYEAKPYELRNAVTHKLIHRFGSLNIEEILGHFNTLKTKSSVQQYLHDKSCRSVPLCFYNFGVLSYLCYKDETIEELEIRTGRSFKKDRDEELKFISKVTVRKKGTDKDIPLSGYDSYAEAARMLGLEKKHWSNFGELVRGKRKSCAGWELVS